MAAFSDDDAVEYEEVDVDDEGVRPSWLNRGNRPSSASSATGNREMSESLPVGICLCV